MQHNDLKIGNFCLGPLHPVGAIRESPLRDAAFIQPKTTLKQDFEPFKINLLLRLKAEISQFVTRRMIS